MTVYRVSALSQRGRGPSAERSSGQATLGCVLSLVPKFHRSFLCLFSLLSAQWRQEFSPPSLPSLHLLYPMPFHPAMSQASVFKNVIPVKVLVKDTDIMKTLYLNSNSNFKVENFR